MRRNCRDEPRADRLGHGHAAARVRLRSRPGRRLPVRDAALRRRGADQPRRRGRPVDRRGGAIGRGGCRLSRPALLRRLQAGRHAAENARFGTAVRAGLAAVDRFPHGPGRDLRLVLCNTSSRRILTMYEQLYRSLYRIRRVEEEIARVYPTDKIKSPVHLSIGQEAVSVGVCEALPADDVVFGTYRGHALYLAEGGDLKRDDGRAVRQGDRLHRRQGRLDAPDRSGSGMMGTSAVVGTTIANAVGYAYALRYRRQDAIVVSFFGDGATEEGVFAESLNFAVLKQLPILFVCENNRTPSTRTRAAGRASRRSASAPAPSGCRRSASTATICSTWWPGRAMSWRHIRAGAGPWFFEVMTYRWREHVGPSCDYHLGYRSGRRGRAVDRQRPGARGWPKVSMPTSGRGIEAKVEEEIADAFAFAEDSPFSGGGRTHPRCLQGGRSCRNSSTVAERPPARYGRGSDRADAVLRRGHPRGDRSGDGARSRRRPLRAGRGRSQGHPGDDARPGGEVRRRARLRHAAVRRRHDRGGHRHGPGRAAADPRPHPHGLPDAGHEPARQRRRQEPLHVRRPGRACRWWCAR